MMRLTEWIDHHAGATPGKTAIRFGSQDISYAALAQKVERLASALAAAGVRRKSCVAWLGYNSPELLALLFACARLGAMFMPLNWRLAAPEHKQMLEDCPPAVLFVEPDFVAQTESILAELGDLRSVVMGGPRAGWQAWDAFSAAGTAAAPRAESRPADTSSGSAIPRVRPASRRACCSPRMRSPATPSTAPTCTT
jgi:Acyl-CoA synthetases (AMP-forming)/AMP-acid ligases II